MSTLDWDTFNTWSILVVEDEPDNAELIVGTLQFYGATVKHAENGAVGLTLLQEFTPQLILADLSMPKLDGWEMHKQIKADPRLKDIPVIALSAHAMDGDKERALKQGFDGYVTKPISIATLPKDLRAALEERKRYVPAPVPPAKDTTGTGTTAQEQAS